MAGPLWSRDPAVHPRRRSRTIRPGAGGRPYPLAGLVGLLDDPLAGFLTLIADILPLLLALLYCLTLIADTLPLLLALLYCLTQFAALLRGSLTVLAHLLTLPVNLLRGSLTSPTLLDPLANLLGRRLTGLLGLGGRLTR